MAGRDGRAHSWALAAAFWVACTGGMALCAPQEAPGDAEIEQAIEQLGAATHAEREAAVGRLIDIGGPAVAALREATGSDDPEVAFRAREALKLIRLGIDSATPRAVRRLAVGIFKEEDGGVRRVALRKLAGKGEPGRRVLRFMASCGDGGAEQAKQLLQAADVGDVKELIVDGRLDEAEFSLWMKCAAKPDYPDDLIAYCLVRGTLERALEEAKTFYARRPRQSTALLLARFHVAAGNAEEALAFARLAGSAGHTLVEGLLVDAGDWNGLAEFYESLMEAEASPAAEGPERERAAVRHPLQKDDPWDEGIIRALGMLATSYRLSGQEEKFQAVVERIGKMAREHYLPASKGPDGRKKERASDMLDVCVEVLVMNRRTDDAVALAVAAEQIEKAAWLRRMQGRFDDADMLEEQAEEDGAGTEEPEDVADWIWQARQFLRKGQKDKALAAAAQAAAAVTDETTPGATVDLIKLERDLGLQEQAEQRLKDLIGDGTADERIAHAMHDWVWPGRYAWSWWLIAGRTMPDLEPVERFRMAKKMARLELSAEDFGKILPAALAVAGAARAEPEDEEAEVPWPFCGLRGGERRALFEAVGDACVHYAMLDEAIRCYEEALSLATDSRLLIRAAHAMARAGKWEDVVKCLRGSWQRHRPDGSPGTLYRLGWALQQAGRPEEGRQKMKIAELLALDTRDPLIAAMAECGQADAVAREKERRAALRGPFGHELNYVPLASEIMGDYREALRLRRRQFLQYMQGRGCYFGWKQSAAMAVAYLDVNRALAALAEGRSVDIEKVAQDIMANSLGDESGVILLVAGLDHFGRKDLADRVFERSMEAFVEIYGEVPQDASYIDDMAWVRACCGRDLDKALRFALEASARGRVGVGFENTLTHVYYARGELGKAVEMQRKFVQFFVGDVDWPEQMRELAYFQIELFEAALAEQEGRADP